MFVCYFVCCYLFTGPAIINNAQPAWRHHWAFSHLKSGSIFTATPEPAYWSLAAWRKWQFVEIAGLGLRPPSSLIRGQAGRVLKWRTAVGGGSLLGPEGAATRALGEKRAGSGSQLPSEMARELLRLRTGSGPGSTRRCKCPLRSETTCRIFGMFWASQAAPAAGR